MKTDAQVDTTHLHNCSDRHSLPVSLNLEDTNIDSINSLLRGCLRHQGEFSRTLTAVNATEPLETFMRRFEDQVSQWIVTAWHG